MADESPAVSVLMPVYNAQRYLSAAVQSILDQTHTSFEFIIIDDGSTDESLTILAKYARRDRRIRLVSRPNTGYVIALNEMLTMACGEFIARMDADDVSMPTRFERQVDYLRAQPQCVGVGSGVVLIDSEGREIRPWSQVTAHEEIDGMHLRGLGGAVTHPAMMFKAWALRQVDGYRPSLQPAEDLDLFLRLSEIGRLANLPDVLLKYRQHAQSVGYQRRGEQVRAALQAVVEAHQRRGLPPPAGIDVSPPRGAGVSRHHRKWAWWALGAGNVATARKHALRALCLSPWSVASWKVMACALRGH
jgi:glycosyltransferase involved in cell wall biosynthesis